MSSPSPALPPQLTLVQHAVLADRLTVLRDRNTSFPSFRRALFDCSAILAVEAARELLVDDVEIETPLESTRGARLSEQVVVVPVLRAGLGMVDGFLRLLPDARVGHLGMARDEAAHTPVDYYSRLPPGMADARVFLLDPMLATGGSAVHAIDRLKRAGAGQLELVCLVAAPEGIAAMQAEHPEIRIWTAAIDRELDSNAYIRPGLGDAGDRVFGTV